MKIPVPYIFGAAVFLLAVFLTDANFWADTADYVESVIAFRQGQDNNFWEFGHLFWRPLGWSVWRQVFNSVENYAWQSELNSIFQWFSYIAGLASTLILVGILRTLKLSVRVGCVVVSGFVFSHAFLNFTQTGTSYVAALMFYLLGLFFSLRETGERNFLYSILTGICLGASLCFWMPFLWTVPAAICAGLVIYGFNRQRMIEAAIKTSAFLLFVGFSYVMVLAVLQIGSLSELKSWITAASHGNETRGAMRMVFGLARSFVNMGGDGILFKRFLLNDPYNPVSIVALITGSFWKFAAFYALVAGVLFLLWQKGGIGRKILILVFVAAVPMLGFATLFDGGAVERYLPLFPFSFIALAVALEVEKRKFLRYGILLILAAFAVVNLSVFSVWTIAGQQKKMASRLELLENKATPKDAIFLVNWTDDLVNFNRSFPFHPLNLRGNFRLTSVVTPGAAQTKQWREEFAARSFLTWENGKNVWLSNRAFSEKPQPDWNWVEGDDKNVNWREFPEFFSKLEIGEKLGNENGFAKILPTDANKNFLREYKDKYAEQIFTLDEN